MAGLESEVTALASPLSLAQRMRMRTAPLHSQAEQTGIVASILSGRVTRADYALYLRNLLPAYQAMERALRRHRGRPGISYLAHRSLHRARRIAADLNALTGPGWLAVLPLLPTGERYAARVAWAGSADGGLLIAHAYTRYLGDLNGGAIMRRHLIRLFGADFKATLFTEFPAITAVGGFVAGFRAALDEAGGSVADPDRVVEEAAVAFEMNIQLSEEIGSFR